MNAQLAMESMGDLHAVSHEPGAELLGGPAHPRAAAVPPRGHLGGPARPAGMALLDGGDFHHHHRAAEHGLGGPLHPAMSMGCETPPGMGMSGTYTTLTPLQPLPPISTVSDKFPHHHHHHHHHPHQRLPGNVSGSFTLMRDERGLAPMNNLYAPYHKDVAGMGQSLSPLSGSGLGSVHGSQQALPHYAHPGAAMPADKMLTPTGFEAPHPAMLSRHGEQHLSAPPAGMVPLGGIPHPPHGHLGAQGHGQLLGPGREQNPAVAGSQAGGGSNSGQMEEINTKEVAQRITTELKRYSIPQAIFAQRVLCRSQGTLSDLLRNPKPWSKLKSGRETFRRMWKWLQEPEFQRMSALRLAGERSRGGTGRAGPRACARPCGGSSGPSRVPAPRPRSPQGCRAHAGRRRTRRPQVRRSASGRAAAELRAVPLPAPLCPAVARASRTGPTLGGGGARRIRWNRRRCAAGTGPGLRAAQRRAHHGLGERGEAGARSGFGLHVRPCPAGAAERESRADVRARRAGGTPSAEVVRKIFNGLLW